MLSRALTSTSHENTTDIPLASNKRHEAKILPGRCVEPGASFHGRK